MERSPQSAPAASFLRRPGISSTPDELVFLGTDFHGAALIYSYYLGLDGEPTLSLQPTEVVDYRYLHLDEAALVGELTEGTKERLDKYGAVLRKLFSEKRKNFAFSLSDFYDRDSRSNP